VHERHRSIVIILHQSLHPRVRVEAVQPPTTRTKPTASFGPRYWATLLVSFAITLSLFFGPTHSKKNTSESRKALASLFVSEASLAIVCANPGMLYRDPAGYVLTAPDLDRRNHRRGVVIREKRGYRKVEGEVFRKPDFPEFRIRETMFILRTFRPGSHGAWKPTPLLRPAHQYGWPDISEGDTFLPQCRMASSCASTAPPPRRLRNGYRASSSLALRPRPRPQTIPFARTLNRIYP
jgi:hypothetical protein